MIKVKTYLDKGNLSGYILDRRKEKVKRKMQGHSINNKWSFKFIVDNQKANTCKKSKNVTCYGYGWNILGKLMTT